jgi:membrane fusion protein (multidrug efflux system)
VIVFLVHYETRGKYHEGTDGAYIRADAATVISEVSGYVDELLITEIRT